MGRKRRSRQPSTEQQATSNKGPSLWAQYRTLEDETNKAYTAMRALQKARYEAGKEAGEKFKTMRALTSRLNPVTRRVTKAAFEAADAKYRQIKADCLEAEANFEHLRAKRNAMKSQLDQGRTAVKSTAATDKQDGMIRRVNMNLARRNPDYLRNTFGRDAEVVDYLRDKKIHVYFGRPRQHAVIDRGGNVTYPDD